MKFFRRIFTTTKTSFFVMGMVIGANSLFVTPAYAQTPKDEVCKGVVSATGGSCDQGAAAGSLSGLVATVIQLFSVVVGVIAVIMIIVGGLKYIMSAGDSNSTTSAKNTILFALIGLVIVALAQVIVNFVIRKI